MKETRKKKYDQVDVYWLVNHLIHRKPLKFYVYDEEENDTYICEWGTEEYHKIKDQIYKNEVKLLVEEEREIMVFIKL